MAKKAESDGGLGSGCERQRSLGTQHNCSLWSQTFKTTTRKQTHPHPRFCREGEKAVDVTQRQAWDFSALKVLPDEGNTAMCGDHCE